MSAPFQIDKKDWKRVIAGGAIVMAGAGLTYFVQDILPGMNFGEYTPIIVAICTILLNIIRKWSVNTNWKDAESGNG